MCAAARREAAPVRHRAPLHPQVSSIIFLVEGNSKYIVTGGWNRKVSVFDDGEDGAMVEAERTITGHEEDILAMAYSPPNFLATSGYDGKLFIWNMDSAVVKFALRHAPSCPTSCATHTVCARARDRRLVVRVRERMRGGRFRG
jgi:WD40 repeat protein